MSKSYEDLIVYQRGFNAALALHKISLEFPKIEQYTLADQIRRASKSICSNIAEGQAKQHFSQAEFRRYLFMAVGSSEEVRVWLKFCLNLGYINQDVWQKMDQEYDEISKMLNGLIRKL